jgi:hypothetical protein
MGLTQAGWVSVIDAEARRSATNAVTLQRTDRHGILGYKPTDLHGQP